MVQFRIENFKFTMIIHSPAVIMVVLPPNNFEMLPLNNCSSGIKRCTGFKQKRNVLLRCSGCHVLQPMLNHECNVVKTKL